MKEKIKKIISQENKVSTRNQNYIAEISSKDKTLGLFPRKNTRKHFFNWTTEKTSTNGSENKKN